jgi:hypothetical protein
MVKQDDFDSKWQLKAGFIAQREPTINKRKAKSVPQKTVQKQVQQNAPPDPKHQHTEPTSTGQDGSIEVTTQAREDHNPEKETT